jgi:hypothetical protein
MIEVAVSAGIPLLDFRSRDQTWQHAKEFDNRPMAVNQGWEQILEPLGQAAESLRRAAKAASKMPHGDPSLESALALLAEEALDLQQQAEVLRLRVDYQKTP